MDASGERARWQAVMLGVLLASTPSNTRAQDCDAAWTIYVNIEGGQYFPGADDAVTNRSQVLSSPSTVPRTAGIERVWPDVRACMERIWAPFDVRITDVDPSPAPHAEIVMAGGPRDIGHGDFLSGLAPWDCNPHPHGIAYVFASILGGDVQELCWTAVQEVAHLWVLDHVTDCRDPMTYISGCGEKRFVDEELSCGEDAPRPCLCGGRTQSSFQRLAAAVGLRPSAPPELAIRAPRYRSVVRDPVTITLDAVDDGEVRSVEVSLDGVSLGTLVAAPWELEATGLALGWHRIEASARDDHCHRTQASVAFTVVECLSDSDCDAGSSCFDSACRVEPSADAGVMPGDAAMPVGALHGTCTCRATLGGSRVPDAAVLALLVIMARRRRRDRARSRCRRRASRP